MANQDVLEAELAELDAQRMALQERVGAARTARDEANSALAAAQEDVEHASTTLAAAAAKLAAAGTELEAHQVALEQALVAVDEAEEWVAEMGAELAAAETALGEAEAGLSAREDELETTQSALDEADDDAQTAGDVEDEAEGSLDDAQDEANDADKAERAATLAVGDAQDALALAYDDASAADEALDEADGALASRTAAYAAAAATEAEARAESAYRGALRAEAERHPGENVLGPYTDYRLRGEQQHLRFTRRYATSRLDDGPLGVGWRHGWQYEIADAGAFVAVTMPDHRTRLFRRTAEGYSPAAGIRHSLAPDAGGGWLLTDRAGWSYRFDAAGDLRSIASGAAGAAVLTFTYDAGRLTAVRDGYGRALLFDYDGDGHVSAVRGPDAAAPELIISFGYDAGRLVTATDATGRVQRFVYGDGALRHHVIEVDAGSAVRARFGYDAAGRLIRREDGRGVTTFDPDHRGSFEVDAGGSVTRYTDVAGHAHERVYDTAGRLTSSTRYSDLPPTEPCSITYTAAGQPARRVRRSRVGDGDAEVAFEYGVGPGAELEVRSAVARGFTRDSAGAAVPFEQRYDFERNARGQLVSATGPTPGVATLEVSYWPANDPVSTRRGQIKTVTTPLGVTRYADYDRHGVPLRVALVDGRTLTRTVDAAGRLLTLTVGDATVGYRYFDSGVLRLVALSDGTFAHWERDAFDRATSYRLSAVDPDTHPAPGPDTPDLLHVAYTRDEHGAVTVATVFDGAGQRRPLSLEEIYLNGRRRLSWVERDAAGRVTRAYNPGAVDGSFHADFEYDARGALAAVTHPDGSRSRLERDGRGRLVGVTREPPQGAGAEAVAVSRYAIDAMGADVVRTDAAGNTTRWRYDDAQRLVGYEPSYAAPLRIVYTAQGRVREQFGAGPTPLRSEYDVVGRPTRLTTGDPAETITLSWGGAGAAVGKLTQVETAGTRTSYGYGADGRVSVEEREIDGVVHRFAFSRHPGGMLASVTYPSGMVVRYERSPIDPSRIGRVVAQVGGADRVLVRDLAYPPSTVPEFFVFGNGERFFAAFDWGLSLTKIQSGPVSSSYGRRGDGFITGATTWVGNGLMPPYPPPDAYSYDLLGRLVTARATAGNFKMKYDAIGNLRALTRDGVTLACDVDGEKLTRIGADPIEHDAYGNRTRDGARTLVWDGWGRLVRVSDGAGLEVSYRYDGLGVLARRQTRTGARVYLFAHFGELLAEIDYDAAGVEVERREYVYLGRDRVATAVHTGGTTRWRYHHNDGLGRATAMTDAEGEMIWSARYTPFVEGLVAPSSTVRDDFRARHHYRDPDTGYHYNFARWYDARVGRYLSPDPAIEGGDLHPYLYARGNALNVQDLFGFEGESDAAGCVVPGLTGRQVGVRVHRQLQKNVMGRFAMGGVTAEGPRIPGAGPNGGYGRPDLVVWWDRITGYSARAREIYEIKPVSASPRGGARWHSLARAQLMRYVTLFPAGNAVPGVVLLPYFDKPFKVPFDNNPLQELHTETFVSDTGMIYYWCTLRPEPEPEPLPQEQEQERRLPVSDPEYRFAPEPTREGLEEDGDDVGWYIWLLVGAAIFLSGGEAAPLLVL